MRVDESCWLSWTLEPSAPAHAHDTAQEAPSSERAHDSAHDERWLEEIEQRLCDLCTSSLGNERGLDTQRALLSGPIRGTCLTFERGDFRATVSLQRFDRPRSLPHSRHAVALRLVATARSQRLTRVQRACERKTQIFAGLARTIALGATALATPWIVASGVGPLLLIALVGSAAISIWYGAGWFGVLLARLITRHSLARVLAQTDHDATLQLQIRQWQALVEQLKVEQVVAPIGGPAPFRRPVGALPLLRALP